MALIVRKWNVYLGNFPLTTWSLSGAASAWTIPALPPTPSRFPRLLLRRPHSPSPVLRLPWRELLLHQSGGKETKSVPSSKKWGCGSPPLPTPRPSLAAQDPAAASLPCHLRGPRALQADAETHPRPSRGRPICPVHSSAAPTAASRGAMRRSSPCTSFPRCPAFCVPAGPVSLRSEPGGNTLRLNPTPTRVAPRPGQPIGLCP